MEKLKEQVYLDLIWGFQDSLSDYFLMFILVLCFFFFLVILHSSLMKNPFHVPTLNSTEEKL